MGFSNGFSGSFEKSCFKQATRVGKVVGSINKSNKCLLVWLGIKSGYITLGYLPGFAVATAVAEFSEVPKRIGKQEDFNYPDA